MNNPFTEILKLILQWVFKKEQFKNSGLSSNNFNPLVHL